MSTLVQQNNSPHYPQSIIMNNNENGGRQQRPTNVPSKNLLPNELQCLFDILGHSRVTLATAVAQILQGNSGGWRKQACGVFCFVKDYDDRNYCFRLYDLKTRQSIYQELVPASLRLEKSLDVFYTFDGLNCKIGINFVDRDEAQTFSHHFHSKQEDRQSKKEKKKVPAPTRPAPPPVQPPSSTSGMSTIMNGIKPPPPNAAAQTLPPQQQAATVSTPKKSSKPSRSGFLTLGRSKSKNIRPDISAPIQSTLVHVGHIGTKDSFFNDESQKQLFEDVLAGLHISPEDRLYVRELVNTDGGLEKLLAKPTPPVRDQLPPAPMSGGPPVIPPRSGRGPHQDVSPQPTGYNQSNNSRSQPLQDLFTPPSGLNQQPVPMIPPRPGPRVPENSHQAPPTAPPPPPPPPFPGGFDSNRTHAPPAPPPPPPPPPPMPNNFTHQTQSTGGPPPPPPPMPSNFTPQTQSTGGPPPPPPPPPPVGSSGSGTSSSSKPAAPAGRDNLLDDIRKFGTTSRLKQSQDRPALPQVTSAGDSSPGAQDTMAMNILKILAERREKLIGPEDDNDSDSSQEDWSS